MTTTLLEQIRVATPCHVSWDAMPGDDIVRHCSQCQLNVYNLSAMTRDAAEAFIAEQEGRVCVRLYRRNDGTVITGDCPVGRRALRRQILALAGAIAAVFFVVTSGVWASTGVSEQRKSSWAGSWPTTSIVDLVKNWWQPEPEVFMGDMCVAQPQMPPVNNGQ